MEDGMLRWMFHQEMRLQRLIDAPEINNSSHAIVTVLRNWPYWPNGAMVAYYDDRYWPVPGIMHPVVDCQLWIQSREDLVSMFGKNHEHMSTEEQAAFLKKWLRESYRGPSLPR